MKSKDAANLSCPFSTTNRDMPVYCGVENCMAWESHGTISEGYYGEEPGVLYGHCKLIDKDENKND